MTAVSTRFPHPDQLAGASVAQLAERLRDGSTTCQHLVSACLARIDDDAGEGARTFRTVNATAAMQSARHFDELRKSGRAPSPYAGIPISVKDLFDVEGETTLAGSTVLAGNPPAGADAPAIASLRAAGLVLIGRTNMTEFAFSGVGMNPHYGTPLNPHDRERGRIPGGSSSGAAVSVADGMAAAGLGTDTGGSCRIPAALCGTAGFKPTARRISRQGVVPLSFSLDSIGSMANSVACCALLDAIMAGGTAAMKLPARPVASLRIGVLDSLALDDLEDTVATAFDRAVHRLAAAGASVTDLRVDELTDLPQINAKGGLASAEAFAWHRHHLATRASNYDPRVRRRIEQGAEQSAADYIDVLQQRRRLIEAANAACQGFDAIACPTVPRIAPALDELTDDAQYARINALLLRNTSITNFLDRCAVSIPIHDPGTAPVGMNLMGETMGDRELLAVATSVEQLLRPSR